jgi:dihydrofolate synthase/folylpolyglutamate synthase
VSDARWTIDDAQRHLLSLELFGMRFGVERMGELMDRLGNPQHRFAAIHVVGTNGKSSTTRMIAAILREHGVRAGAYLSPHLIAFNERVRVDDADITTQAFADALQEAAAAAQQLDAAHEPDDQVTQFELLTAAGYVALAAAGVEVGVIEAGLGGRYDATNVLDTSVAVLTNVSLEHTRWLGPTISHIASEKLAVVTEREPPMTLVVGAHLHPDALALAKRAPALLIEAEPEPPPGVEVHAPGAYQRRNFALAIAAAQAFRGALEDDAVNGAAAAITIPGRFEIVDTQPTTMLDGAHNPGGTAVLLESLQIADLPDPFVVVMSVLDDKNAAEMLRNLIPHTAQFVFTTTPNARTLPPGTLVSLNRQLGGPPARTQTDPHAALATARELAGPTGAVLATGTLALVGELLRRQPTDRR